jgi:magnesium transporter
VRVAFILYDGVLFSVHDEDLPVFRAAAPARAAHPGAHRGRQGRAAQALRRRRRVLGRRAGRHLRPPGASERAGAEARTSTTPSAGEALAAIAREEDLNGRIRRNVMDTRRALSFMMRSRMLNAEQFEEARQILRDIDSLDSHTAFLFDKINFLMDATVGFININQNKIIKIFSVASVALLPPTLIASVYGMNFKSMPELDQPWGYPFAIGADGRLGGGTISSFPAQGLAALTGSPGTPSAS